MEFVGNEGLKTSLDCWTNGVLPRSSGMATSSTLYGIDLAERVAAVLARGHSLMEGHRDYCGMGLTLQEGRYCYGVVYDGWMQTPSPEKDGKTFEQQADFIAWLAGQSDASLSRREMKEAFYHDNQTIRRERLMDWIEAFGNLPRIDVRRWIHLWEQLPVKSAQTQSFGGLCAAYSEPHRAYHNLRHLEECLRELDAVYEQARQPAVLEMALWFHDAVYDPQTTSENEEMSADWARDVLEESGAPNDLIDQVRRLILLTKHHVADATPDAGLMCDIDLAILGQSEERVEEYERAIRQEYRWVPEQDYRTGRGRVLETFLNRKSIYVTEIFADRYEAAARSNLKASLERLAVAKRF